MDSDDSEDEKNPEEFVYTDPSTLLLLPTVKHPQKTPKSQMKILRKRLQGQCTGKRLSQRKSSLLLAVSTSSHLA